MHARRGHATLHPFVLRCGLEIDCRDGLHKIDLSRHLIQTPFLNLDPSADFKLSSTRAPSLTLSKFSSRQQTHLTVPFASMCFSKEMSLTFSVLGLVMSLWVYRRVSHLPTVLPPPCSVRTCRFACGRGVPSISLHSPLPPRGSVGSHSSSAPLPPSASPTDKQPSAGDWSLLLLPDGIPSVFPGVYSYPVYICRWGGVPWQCWSPESSWAVGSRVVVWVGWIRDRRSEMVPGCLRTATHALSCVPTTQCTFCRSVHWCMF